MNVFISIFRWNPFSIFFRLLLGLLVVPMLIGNWFMIILYMNGDPEQNKEYTMGTITSLCTFFLAVTLHFPWFWIFTAPFYGPAVVVISYYAAPVVADQIKKLDKRMSE